MVPFGGLGHAAVLPDGHAGRAPGLPHAARSCSTSATSAPCGSRAPAPSTACRRRSPTTSAKIGPGRAQYTHLLDAADASVLDDIIVWWVDDERFDVMPNASNTDRVRRRPSGGDGRHRRRGRSSPCRAPTARRAAGRRRARGRRGGPLPAWPGSTWDGVDLRRSPAPATPARTASSWPCRPTPRRRSGRRCSAPASCRPASAPATRCAWRPACRCTATSWARASPRCRPAWAGSSAGTRATSGAGTPLAAEQERGRRAGACAGLAVEGRRPPRAEQAGAGRRRSRRA